jgi:formylglycine-generating enzyme required for sulfatase activity
MNGNVWEWVSDKWDRNYYKNSPKYNPNGPGKGSSRVSRGGSWDDFPMSVRCSVRNEGNPDRRGIILGLRLVRTP